ncbi:MAG: helix-turn-helix domain-containing protein, partial [Nanoarchaeota archaeon]
QYAPTLLMESPEALAILSHPLRKRILEILAKEPRYPAELAKIMKLHEQKVYYHVKQLMNAGLLEVVEKQEIRGTIARKLQPKYLNFSYSLSDEWKSMRQFHKKEKTVLHEFLEPFIKDGKLDCRIVVGSPDLHGPYKASARDGHYAVDLALFLGQYCELSKDFSVKLDVDVKNEKAEENNLIVVGGPGTNLITQEINAFAPVKFNIHESEHGFLCSGIEGKKNYAGETDGIIVRMPNPYNNEKYILLFAGFRCIGSKTAVMGLTQFTSLILQRFSGQKSFGCVVRGFDLDGDGKIDSVEVME